MKTRRKLHLEYPEFIQLFLEAPSRKEYLDGMVKLIQRLSGCRCVGVRVLDLQKNIPYESYAGFSQEFCGSENWLSVEQDQCACVRVITQRMEPQDASVMTPAGSLHCNDTLRFLSGLAENERARYRGVCANSGLASVAVIPIRYRDKVLGLVHLADETKGKVPRKTVEFIESMAPLIGEAMYRLNVEDELRRNYDIQSLINSLLGLSSEDIRLDSLLGRALGLLLSVKWLSFESKGCIFLIEDDPDFLIMKVQQGLPESLQKSCARVPVGKCLCGRAASEAEIQFAECVDNRHGVRTEGVQPHGHYCVPILLPGRLLGVMNIYVREGHRRDPGEVEFLTAIANTMAGLIMRKRVEEEIKRLNEDLERRIRQRTSELEEANEELEAFVYSASHDLRSPLLGMQGLSQILIKKDSSRLSPEGQRSLDLIQKSTKQMIDLIDDLLIFSRIKQKELEFTAIDMRELTEDVFGELKSLCSMDVPRLELKSLPPGFGDKAMIRQVLFNLLSNAVKYSKKKSDRLIEVGGWINEKQNVYYVKDNGVGFENQYAGKLFQAFQRLHDPEEFEGTGIGLAIVERIIHRHGGRVWAEGAVNEGAAFYFTLPRA